jgi:hypothetical protein
MDTKTNFIGSVAKSRPSVVFGKKKELSPEEHLESRKKYETHNETQVYLWFISSIAVQILAISILVVLIMIFLN